jgi:hypothetical protein
MKTAKAGNFLADQAITTVLREALAGSRTEQEIYDLLYLEHWEVNPLPGPASALRVRQIRRANPGLLAAIRDELQVSAGRGRYFLQSGSLLSGGQSSDCVRPPRAIALELAPSSAANANGNTNSAARRPVVDGGPAAANGATVSGVRFFILPP